MVVNIGFGAINVNAQRRNASISVGETSQGAWSSHEKKNFGYGMPFGINNQFNIVNNISDFDAVDTPIQDSDFIQPNQNQTA